jgi:phosphoribosylformimino-5-aminoimidazole carboxamide ribotide isomerase
VFIRGEFPRGAQIMIIPCIDLMAGKAVQLVRGREKALECDALDQLERFLGFPEIQLIDLDAALGQGDNDALVTELCARGRCRVGGGVRTAERARRLTGAGAHRIIVGTAAFGSSGVNADFLENARAAVGRERLIVALDSEKGRIVVKGWREATAFSAEDVVRMLEPYCGEFLCTYVDREGTMSGTDLDWFRRLRAATALPITAAGGIYTMDEIRALDLMGVHAALGMAVYTGRLRLDDLRAFDAQTRF